MKELNERWTDIYNKFTNIVNKHNPNENNFEKNINKEVEKLYANHKGEVNWDKAYKRWTDEEVN